jgi:hypothetical protein
MVRWKNRYCAIRVPPYNIEYGQCYGRCSATAGRLDDFLVGWDVGQLALVIHSVRVVEHKKCVLVAEKRLKPVPSVGQQTFAAKEFAELFRSVIS